MLQLLMIFFVSDFLPEFNAYLWPLSLTL